MNVPLCIPSKELLYLERKQSQRLENKCITFLGLNGNVDIMDLYSNYHKDILTVLEIEGYVLSTFCLYLCISPSKICLTKYNLKKGCP